MNNILNFLISPNFSGFLWNIRIIFLISGLALFGFIVFALLKSNWLKNLFLDDLAEFLTYRPAGLRKVTKQWLRIMARLETGLESEFKLAVIEADLILDDVLIRMGYRGETFEERLKPLSTIILPNIEEVREIHRVRDNIVHDPDFRLDLALAKRALAVYEKSLSDLNVF